MRRILLFICFIAFAINLFCQTATPVVISTIGNYYKQSNVSLSWTLGETIIATLENDNITLTQGFQQPKYSITAINENNLINPDIILYPNPTTNILHINYNTKSHNQIKAAIYNIEGKKLFEKQMNNSENTIDLSSFESSIYLLKIYDIKGNIINTYKIQKLN